MYRQQDPQRNVAAVKSEEFPAHITVCVLSSNPMMIFCGLTLLFYTEIAAAPKGQERSRST